MISFPNCKINLGLQILNKREDGYHDIDSVFYPVGLKDVLEFVESDEMKFTTSGLKIPGKEADNIILKAYNLLKQDYSSLPSLHIHLHKHIPMGAGMGGGSGNGAYLLKMLNDYFELGIQTERLIEYALKLGSDCPFFIYNTVCKTAGRGEILTPISLDLSNYYFALVYPKIHINTAMAFSQIKPMTPDKYSYEIIQQPISTWKEELKNSFEAFAFDTYPLLAQIKENLYKQGAVYSSMSGSGSTLYGLFEKDRFEVTQLKVKVKNEFRDMEVFWV